MLDPLTALSVASNVLQLISFASDLFSKSREYHKTANGALIKQLELGAIAQKLQNLSQNLVTPAPSTLPPATNTEQQLDELCGGCREISKELISIIASLKSGRPQTRWDSFRQALKGVCKEKQIKTLEARLDRFRRQMDTTLLISLRESIHDRSTSDIRFDRAYKLKQWQREFLIELRQKDQELRQVTKVDMANFSAKLSASVREDEDALMRAHILQTLCFNNLKDRSERIPKAHQKHSNGSFGTATDQIEGFVDLLSA